MSKPSILVVEDDGTVRNMIAAALETQSYSYRLAETGSKAISEAMAQKPDIMLLDLGLPDMDGVNVIAKVREWSNMPIIVISARNDDPDKVHALDAGADDYLTKPFSVDELLARLRSTQRRLQYMKNTETEEEGKRSFKNGGLLIDYDSGCVYLEGQELHLTPIEYRLLCLLAQNVGKVLAHTYITREIGRTAW